MALYGPLWPYLAVIDPNSFGLVIEIIAIQINLHDFVSLCFDKQGVKRMELSISKYLVFINTLLTKSAMQFLLLKWDELDK